MIMLAPITSIKKRYCYIKKMSAVKSNNDSIILLIINIKKPTIILKSSNNNDQDFNIVNIKINNNIAHNKTTEDEKNGLVSYLNLNFV